MKYVLCLLLSLTASFSFAQSDVAQVPAPNAPSSDTPEIGPVDGAIIYNPAPSWRFGIGGSLSSMVANFRETKVGANQSEVLIGYKGGVSLDLDARYMRPQSWGFLGALILNTNREEDTLTETTSSGATFTGTITEKGTISSHSLMANAVYQWDIYYLPFGINMSTYKYDAKLGSATSKGGVGIQIGSGWWINDNFAIELWYKSTSVELKRTVGTTEYNFGNGSLAQFLVSGKYIF